jgi:uncharacterized protein YbaR (Trm112 family)
MATAHDINMADPAVRRLLGKDDADRIVTPGEVEQPKMVQIAGDMDTGITSTTRLDLGKVEVVVAAKDHVLTVDVYAIPGEPLKVHLICPRCKHQLTIDQSKKAIDWDPLKPSPLPRSLVSSLPRELQINAVIGILSVATFQCTWELEDEMQDKHKDVHIVAASGSLCRFRAAIDRNVLKEA